MSSDNTTVPTNHNSSSRRQHRNPHRESLRRDREDVQRASYSEPQTSHTYTDKLPQNSYNHEQHNTHHASSPRNSQNAQRSSRNHRNEHDVERQGRPARKGHELKNHFIAASGEFVGTFMFLYFAFATHLMAATQFQTDGIPAGGVSSQTVIFVSLGYGFSLLVTVWVWYRISGGLFNPAITLGLVLSSALPPLRGLVLLPAQILGACSAAALVSVMFPGEISIVNTTLGPGVSIVQGLFIEMFLTCLLMITVLMLAVEKSNDTFLAPIGIGLALFVAEITGVFYTGGSLNPARSFGPAVASTKFPGYHWIYWLGPCLGAVVTSGYFRFLKWMKYEEANPGQDSTGEEE